MDAWKKSREVGIREKEVYDHLTYIARSLTAKGKALLIQPSRCLSCSYVFENRKRFITDHQRSSRLLMMASLTFFIQHFAT